MFATVHVLVKRSMLVEASYTGLSQYQTEVFSFENWTSPDFESLLYIHYTLFVKIFTGSQNRVTSLF